MKKLFSTVILGGTLLFQPTLAHEESEAPNFADTIVLVLTHAALNLGLAFAHELGHAVAAHLFVKCGAPLIQDPQGVKLGYAVNNPIPGIDINSPLDILGRYPEFRCELLNALVHISGPLSGLLASYALLKTTSIAAELSKDKKIVKAIKNGFKKPLFNEEQPAGIRGLAFSHFLINGFMLLPYGTQSGILSDGEKIRQCFART